MAQQPSTFVVRLNDGSEFEVRDTHIGKLLDGCVIFHNANGDAVALVPIASLVAVRETGCTSAVDTSGKKSQGDRSSRPTLSEVATQGRERGL